MEYKIAILIVIVKIAGDILVAWYKSKLSHDNRDST